MKIKKTKIIVGLIGDHGVGKTTAANIFKKKGFFKASINEKVEEFTRHLFENNDWMEKKNTILNNVRKKGYKNCKSYWLNLILITVPDDKNFIVFDDMSLEDTENKGIYVVQIYRPSVSREKLEDIETIENNGTIDEFKEKIEELYKKLTTAPLKK